MNQLDTGIVIDNMEKDSYSPAIISTITLIEALRGVDDKKRRSTMQLLEESFSIIEPRQQHSRSVLQHLSCFEGKR